MVIIVAILVVIALRIVKLVNNCWCNNHIQPNQDYHGYLTEIYVELFDNIDYVRLKICSIRHHASNLRLSCHKDTTVSVYNRGLLMDTLVLDYQGSLVICKNMETSFGLPVYVQIPMLSKFTMRKMLGRCNDLKWLKTRLIGVSDCLVYDLLRNVHKTTYNYHAETQTDVQLEIEEENDVYAVMN